MMEANDKLTQLAVEKEKARLRLSNREEKKRRRKKTTKKTYKLNLKQRNHHNLPQITPKAKKWAEENDGLVLMKS